MKIKNDYRECSIGMQKLKSATQQKPNAYMFAWFKDVLKIKGEGLLTLHLYYGKYHPLV